MLLATILVTYSLANAVRTELVEVQTLVARQACSELFGFRQAQPEREVFTANGREIVFEFVPQGIEESEKGRP